MAEVKQTLLTPDPPGNLSMGNRNDENIKASFPDSPLPGYEGAVYSDQERANTYQVDVLSGERSGHGISNFNLDFEGTSEQPVPDVAGNDGSDTEAGTFGEGKGAPTTAFIPPLVSPGPGSVSADDHDAYTGTTKPAEQVSIFGSGLGGLANPSDTSVEISKQSVLIDYISGKSYAGSS